MNFVKGHTYYFIDDFPVPRAWRNRLYTVTNAESHIIEINTSEGLVSCYYPFESLLRVTQPVTRIGNSRLEFHFLGS